MKYYIIVGLMAFGVSFRASSQSFPLSAKAAGMGHTAVTLQDAWSCFQNVGGLGAVKKSTFLFGYHNSFGMRDGLHTAGAGVVIPTSVGVGSVSVSKFGDHLFSRQTLSLGYGHQVDQFTMGIRMSQQQYSLEYAGTQSLFILDVGGVATLIPELVWGLQVRNITRTRLSDFSGEHVPTLIETGLSYRPVSSLMLNVEVAQEVNQTPSFKAGIAYCWQKKVTVRTGFNTQFLQHYMGMGWTHRILQIDYALSTHASLGHSHQLSLAYTVNKKDK